MDTIKIAHFTSLSTGGHHIDPSGDGGGARNGSPRELAPPYPGEIETGANDGGALKG